MSVPDRLRQIRGDRSQRDIASDLKVAVNSWRRYESGEREPSAEILRELARTGWNPTWVLTGEGDERLSPDTDAKMVGLLAGQLLGDPESERAYAEESERLSKARKLGQRMALSAYPDDLQDYCFVPHLSVRAAAGAGQVVESEQIVAWMAFRRSYLQSLGVPARSACLIRVRGHSMDPDLRDGDTVLIDTSDTTPTARPGVFAFRVGNTGELAVKRISARADGTWDISGAPDWPTQCAVPRDEQPLVIGRVRWSGRTWS